jgi:replicative DNA helicase
MSAAKWAGVPPHDLDHEAAVLGAILSSSVVLPYVRVEEGLRPGHFYRERYAAIYSAALGLAEAGEPVDLLTVAAELQRRGAGVPEAELDLLTAAPPSVGNIRAYARRVVELARLRQKAQGAYAILEGVAHEDRDRIAEGEAGLVVEHTSNATSTPEELGVALLERHKPGARVEAFPFPFDLLNYYTAGGMRPGGVTLVGGWSSHGKSVFLDQILEGVAKRARVHLYINEMTREERVDRYAARAAGLDLSRLLMGRVRDDEYKALFEAAKSVPYGITDAAELGGDVSEVVHHIRANSFQVVGVDILHLFDHDEERDLARISRALNRVAKAAKCHVVATVHLNEKRVIGATRPPPTLGDIRGSGMLKNDADNVAFVFREQVEDGTELLDEGRVYFAKVRQGVLGGVPVIFNGRRARFELDATAPGPAAF